MMPAANTMPAVGEVIGEGRFELLGKLGEGGMSLVFLARDLELGRQVALKLLLPRYVGRPEREQRLINEAEYLRRLKGHPNIIEFVAEGRLHDRGDWPWLATEVLQGTVLDWSGRSGNIRIRGEVWAARGARPFAPGDAVRVKDRDGLVLVVEPV